MKISIDVTPSFPEVILCKFHLSRIFRLNVALLRMNLLYFVIIFRNFRYFPFSHCIAASTDHKKCYYSWGDFVTNYHQIRRASIEGGANSSLPSEHRACISHLTSHPGRTIFNPCVFLPSLISLILQLNTTLHWWTLPRGGSWIISVKICAYLWLVKLESWVG